MLKYLGRLKFRLMRVNPYIGLFNTSILVTGFGWKDWYVLALLAFVVAFLFEKKYGLPGEMEVAFKSNPEWMKFKEEWDEFRQTH